MSVNFDKRSVFEGDVPTDVQQVEVAADRDVGVGPGVQRDALKNVERVQGAADVDRCAGPMELKAIRSTVVVPLETSGPKRFAEWKPSIAPIEPLLTVIWPMLRYGSLRIGRRRSYRRSPCESDVAEG